VLIPPSDPGREFVDIKSAIRAAREAIAANDPEALEEAIQSAEPGSRTQIASGLREELLVRGTAQDDPLIAALDEQLELAESVVPVGNGLDGDAADGAAEGDSDSPDADQAGAGQQLAPSDRGDTPVNPFEPNPDSSVPAEESDGGGIIRNGVEIGNGVGDQGGNGQQSVPVPPADTPVNPFEPNPDSGAAAGDAAEEDLDFGAGAAPSTDPVVAVPPGSAPQPADPAADAEADFGGDDFFGGERGTGEVIPIEEGEAGADDIAGGDDFFGGEIDGGAGNGGAGNGGAGNDGGGDGGFLTPEEIAELAAIEAETADAIIDNIGR
jgi:hypothetical protein